MRKDLRLGLGIGALALLFAVTFLVVRNHTQNQAQQEPELAQVVDGDGPPLANGPAGTPGVGTLPTLPTEILPPLQEVVPGAPHAKASPADDNPFAKQPSHTPEPPMPSGGQARRTDTNWDALLSEGRRGASSAAISRAPDPILTTPHTDGVEHVESSTARANQPQGHTNVPPGRPYTIRQGDTFSSVAKETYGAERYYLQIERANPNVNTLRLRPGQKIILPELAVSGSSGQSAQTMVDHEDYNRPINPRYEYRVDTGDSLSRISMKLYGTVRMIDALYEANRAAIGSDPDQLRLGMILRIPPEPGSGK